MNLYALVAGFLVAVYVVVGFRKTKFERKKWVYPLLLASFPAYYWAFAVYGSDSVALQKELVAGALFIALSVIAYQVKGKVSLALLAIGYIGHAVYDIAHNSLFVNSGAPEWWPEFCGSVDLLLGLYLVYLAVRTPSRAGSTNAA
jgi:hypothetical protein